MESSLLNSLLSQRMRLLDIACPRKPRSREEDYWRPPWSTSASKDVTLCLVFFPPQTVSQTFISHQQHGTMVGGVVLERTPAGYVAPQQLTRPQFIYDYSVITSLFFTWGFAYGLLDSLNKHFQQVFNITKTQSTFMQVAYFGAYFLRAPWAVSNEDSFRDHHTEDVEKAVETPNKQRHQYHSGDRFTN